MVCFFFIMVMSFAIFYKKKKSSLHSAFFFFGFILLVVVAHTVNMIFAQTVCVQCVTEFIDGAAQQLLRSVTQKQSHSAKTQTHKVETK